MALFRATINKQPNKILLEAPENNPALQSSGRTGLQQGCTGAQCIPQNADSNVVSADAAAGVESLISVRGYV